MKTKDQKEIHRNYLNTVDKGLARGWTRTTLVIREEYFERLKDFAYWERTNVKDLFDEIVEKFISSREIKPRPKEKKKILG